MALEQKDLEAFERILYKANDDIAVSIARSFERLEERIDGAESRLYSRFTDIEAKVDESAQETTDGLRQVRGDVREFLADEE